jgi:hypothetical protein
MIVRRPVEGKICLKELGRQSQLNLQQAHRQTVPSPAISDGYLGSSNKTLASTRNQEQGSKLR